MVGRSRAWWVAGSALVGGGVVWAVLRFGVACGAGDLADERAIRRKMRETVGWETSNQSPATVWDRFWRNSTSVSSTDRCRSSTLGHPTGRSDDVRTWWIRATNS